MMRSPRRGQPIALLAAAALATLATLLASSGAASAAEGELSRYRLANGLQILVYEKHNVPVAAVEVWYRTGGLNEHPGIRGLSHFLEHMMFRGSTAVGPEEHDRRVEALGGSANAYTDQDVTVYHQVVPASAVDTVLALEADRMAGLTLDPDLFAVEREVVIEEYHLRVENDLMGRALYRLAREYFGEHPYSWIVIGTLADLEAMTVDDMRDYYRARYTPPNAALIVVGDVEPDEVRARAEVHFGAIAPGVSPAPDPPPPAPPARTTLETAVDLPVPVTAVIYRLPPAGDADAPGLEVLVRMLQWELDRRLTRERKLCVYTTAEVYQMRQCVVAGFIGAHLPNIAATRVESAVVEAIDEILARGIDPAELDRVRNQLLLEERERRYSVRGIAREIGSALYIRENLDDFDQRLARIAALTPADLEALGRRHLGAGNRTFVYIVPEHPSKLIYLAGWFKSLFGL